MANDTELKPGETGGAWLPGDAEENDTANNLEFGAVSMRGTMAEFSLAARVSVAERKFRDVAPDVKRVMFDRTVEEQVAIANGMPGANVNDPTTRAAIESTAAQLLQFTPVEQRETL